MAIIDIVKYEQKEGELVHRFPSHDLRWGTQLVVYPGQVAFFMKGGKLCDSFSEGTYTLHTNNIPILNKLVNMPFGSDSPFQADVWFVNLLTKLDLRWGTENPIQLEDPKYNIIVPVRAYGQYGIKVSNPHSFVSQLVGNRSSFAESDLQSYFRGILLSKLTSIISKKIIKDEISVLDINAQLDSISQYCQQNVSPTFNDYGVEVVNFSIISISIPDNDESLEVIKRAKSFASRLNITGKENYQMERTFDVMDAAAKNESNGGNMLNAGIGLSAGMAFGSKMVGNTGLQATPPPIPTEPVYYMAVNGKQQGPYKFEQVRNAIAADSSLMNVLAWKAGLPNWMPLSSFEEFQQLGVVPPPIK